jgi:hypothetical protein
MALGCGANLPEVRELSDLLGVELAPVRVERRSTTPLLEVSTTCTSVDSVTLLDGDSLKTLPVSLEDVAPELRPVALAVLTAEFLRSIWGAPASSSDAEPSEPPAAANAPAAVPSPPAVVEKAPVAAAPSPPASQDLPTKDGAKHRPPQKSREPRLGAGALVRYFAGPGSILGGGELSFGGPPFFTAVNATFGSANDSLGRISLGIVAACVGVRLSLAKTNQTTWWLATAGEFGWTWASGTSTSARMATSTDTFFAALTLGPELDIPVDDRLSVTFGVRAGAARGVVGNADGREVGGTQGFTLSSNAVLHYAL